MRQKMATATFAVLAPLLLLLLWAAPSQAHPSAMTAERTGPVFHNDYGVDTHDIFASKENFQKYSWTPAAQLSCFLAAHAGASTTENVLQSVPQRSSLRKYVVTFDHVLSESEMQKINERIYPYVLGTYFPHNSFEVWGDSKMSIMSGLFDRVDGYKALRALEPHHKIDSTLFEDLDSLSKSLFRLKTFTQQAQTVTPASLVQQRLMSKLASTKPLSEPAVNPLSELERAKSEALEAAKQMSQVSTTGERLTFRVLLSPQAMETIKSSVDATLYSTASQMSASPTSLVQATVQSWAWASELAKRVKDANESSAAEAQTVVHSDADNSNQLFADHPCNGAIFEPGSRILGHELLLAHIPLEYVPSCVAWLASRHEVQVIERSLPFEPLNERANYLLQDSDYSTRVFEAHALTGDGELVMVADTGLDYDHCLFRDPSESPTVANFSPGMTFNINSNARKVVFYLIFNGDDIDADGHGTHVAGSIIGDPLSGLSPDLYATMNRYRGTASKAKIIFVDVGKGDSLIVDNNLPEVMKKSHDLGARTSSHSWGRRGEYDTFARMIDEFLYNNPTHLALVAAGNSGISSSYSYYTVLNPGLAKNVLTVGAAQNLAPMIYFNVIYTQPTSAPTSIGVLPAAFGRAFSGDLVDSVEAVFYPTTSAPSCTTISNPSSLNGKVVVIRRGVCTFSAIALALTKIEQNVKMLIVVNNEADGIVRMSDDAASLDISIPLGMVAKEPGEKLITELQAAGQTVQVTGGVRADDTDVPVQVSSRTMTEFSSRGPSFDGRLKPEITSPGAMIVSALSDGKKDSNNCWLTVKSGTSMATPLAAGMMILARQYFTQGFYPTGKPVGADAFSPSAALLKAVAATSARQLAGQVRARSPLGWHLSDVTDPPSTIQGYGRLQLDRILHFNDDESPTYSPNLFVVDDTAIADQEIQPYCFKVTSTEAVLRDVDDPIGFKATIAWTDPIGSLNAKVVLVNNLDLVVEEQGKTLHSASNPSEAIFENPHRVYLGNNPESTNSDVGDQLQADVLNNIEQVKIPYTNFPSYDKVLTSKEYDENPTAASEKYIAVYVIGRSVPGNGQTGSSQKYALVASGGAGTLIEKMADMTQCEGAQLYQNANVPCPKDCSNQGTCGPTGVCTCSHATFDATYPATGAACDIVPRSISDCVSGGGCDNPDPTPYDLQTHFDVRPNTWSYFRMDRKAYSGSSTLVLTHVEGYGDADIYYRVDALPTSDLYDGRNVECNTCGGPRATKLTIPASALESAHEAIYIGVYGTCCDSAVYTLSFFSSPRITPSIWMTAFGVLAAIAVALVVGFFLYKRCYLTPRSPFQQPAGNTAGGASSIPSFPEPASVRNARVSGIRANPAPSVGASGYPAVSRPAHALADADVQLYGQTVHESSQPGEFSRR